MSASAPDRSVRPLVDGFGRRVTYLRLSVTDRCDLRCAYCMDEGVTFLPKRDLLSLEELVAVADACIARGVERLRITGGEPLHRRGIDSLLRALGQRLTTPPALSTSAAAASLGSGPGSGLRDLALTTNATRLVAFAPLLADCGVRRVNVSLDTLRPDRYAALTRGGDLARVLAGIEAARAAGLAVKINTVALGGLNEDEIDDLLAWCGDRGLDLALIEAMPLGAGRADRPYLPLSLERVRADLARRWTLRESSHRTGGPARYWDCAETGTRVGLITPLSHGFCDGCNRVRLTCTGRLFLCLGQDDSLDLRAVLRDPATTAAGPDAVARALDAALDEAMRRKPRGHAFDAAAFAALAQGDEARARMAGAILSRQMNTTGG